uniref:NBS-containing resistance-like protein n=1 Tax=Tanacetum cinerariifolium TaxID=118510 RepID=A0A6L2P411_TANCI|nr:NBS-containing resistance-like protein [Tanacetum cinerariifolium]
MLCVMNIMHLLRMKLLGFLCHDHLTRTLFALCGCLCTSTLQMDPLAYKARLFANGSNQQIGVDYDETFSPLVTPATIRTVLSISVSRDATGMFLYQRKYAMGNFGACNLTDFLCMHDPREPHQVGCLTTRPSTSGYCVFLGKNLLSCSSKHQDTLTRSSAEAEYRDVANVVSETAWLRNLLPELHSPLQCATLVYCDNVSVVYMSSNPIQHPRTKHVETDIHFVSNQVAAGHVRVLYVPSCYQFTDIFTKRVPYALFDDIRSSLSVRPSLTLTAEGC